MNPQATFLLRHFLSAEQAALLDHSPDLPAPVRASLAETLRSRLATYASFVPSRILQAQLADPKPGRISGAFWEGSLLFADLSGFTKLSEHLSGLGRQGSEEISAVISYLFENLIAEIYAHQGMLLKFGGDALTAFFDSASLGSLDAAAAAAAALAMQRRMARFANLQTRVGTFTLSLRVGVHSGRVFAAEVGDSEHIELVVTGPEVNRVALAQEIAEPGQVVISDQTAMRVPAVTLRGKGQGFHLLEDLPAPELPSTMPSPLDRSGPDDMATLVRLAEQLAALRPYLVHGLPNRFLEPETHTLGEFRPVSVLFANLHDFSALLGHLQERPDTAAAIFNAYYRRAQTVVHHYEGIVNKVDMYTHGDKLMALFGAPSAHEDDPTRAVRCALDLRGALDEANAEIAALLQALPRPPALEGPGPLFQKIGLNTGTVFAGRVGGAVRYEYTVMGSQVNLAARLMAAANDGEVFISPSTRTAVASQFELVDGSSLRLKGIAQPVIPARVLGLARGVSQPQREDLPVHFGHTPLIGRDAELEALFEASGAALHGQGRVLSLIGEAGAGKSRLAEELLQRLIVASVARDTAGVPTFTILLSECQSYEQRTPYAALRGPLRSLLSLGPQSLDGPELAEHLVARVTQLAPDLERFTPLLGDALGINLTDSPLTRSLSLEQRRDRLQELVIALIAGLATQDPLLLLVEDAHWADLPSQELLARLAEAAPGLPLLLVVTYRSEPPIAAPWQDQAQNLTLRLNELGAEESATLLTALLGGTPPPAILPLLERTQGNPFFIQELVRALIANQVLCHDSAEGWRLARRLDEVELPKSIEGLLMARLDRLDESYQELVQVASVIGRRFQRPVVEGLYGRPERLDESLQRLIGFELIQAEQLERFLAYLFRHALLRDVAYEGILYARRRVLHGRVARRIEELSQDHLEDQLAVLAWHYLQAEEFMPALHYHLHAAEQAVSRFANRDALALYATALSITRHLEGAAEPEPGWLQGQCRNIHEQSGQLRLLLGEYDDAEAHFREALSLARPDEELWLRLHRLLASVEERRSRYEAAFTWLNSGMATAAADLHAEQARCYLLGAGLYYRQGLYQQALEWANQGLGLAEQVGSQADQAHALKLIGNINRDQGELPQAISYLERACTAYEGLNLPGGLCDTLNDLGMLYLRLGRWIATVDSYEQSLQISESIGDVQAVARTSNNLAVVLVGRNQLERAAELYQLSSTMFGRIGSTLGVVVTTANRGEVLLLQGRSAEALPLLIEAITICEQIGARSFLSEFLRMAAEAALAYGDREAARSYAQRSLAFANELGMTPEAAIAHRILGQVALAEDNLELAQRELEQSLAALAHLDNRYELGKTRYQQARLALALNDQATFAIAHTEAMQIFHELDAQRDLALASTLISP